MNANFIPFLSSNDRGHEVPGSEDAPPALLIDLGSDMEQLATVTLARANTLHKLLDIFAGAPDTDISASTIASPLEGLAHEICVLLNAMQKVAAAARKGGAA
jgi:hypothetical protein